MTFHQQRQIICEVCGQQCQTRHRKRDICRRCYEREPSKHCVSCGDMKHLVSEVTGLCPDCAERAAHPEAECSRCLQIKVIYNQQDRLCRTCHTNALRRSRYKKGRAVKLMVRSFSGRLRRFSPKSTIDDR